MYAAVTVSAEFLVGVSFGDARRVAVFTVVVALVALLLSADLKPLLVLTAALSCASEMAWDDFLFVLVLNAADEDDTCWG